MILSRTLAKSRIAEGRPTSRAAAWLPVLFDAVLLFGILFSIFPSLSSFLQDKQIGIGLSAVVFFVLYFVPIQLVMVFSALWAAKSRHSVDPTDDQ